MGMIRLTAGAIVILALATVFNHLCTPPPIPVLEPNPWWGPGEQPKSVDTRIRNFKISISDEDVEDLGKRLSLPTRYTKGLENANFTYGMTGEVLSELVKYWNSIYSWRKREKRLNMFPHFITEIEGLDIHFIHVKPQLPSMSKVKVKPLLLIHGWPGSFVEFMDIIPLLTKQRPDSDVVFEVIAPSLPGYGFSQGSSKTGLGCLETAQIFSKLMRRLGHEKFYVQGGDWGSLVATTMGFLYPEKITGVHVNMAAGFPFISKFKVFLSTYLPSGWILPKIDEEKLFPLSAQFKNILLESGYMHIQATKPDTIGNALNSSPVALLAYIMEKFSTWTHGDYVNHPNGGLMESNFPINRDALLDNICVYWFTKSIVTSQRYYAENLNNKENAFAMDDILVNVPSGIAAFPQELIRIPESLARNRYTNLLTFKDMERGGHFAAMEVPELVADHVFHFVNIVENLNVKAKSKEM